METVNTDIINYIQYIGCGTFGKDLFYGRVPNSNKAPVALWWISPDTSSLSAHNVTGEDTIEYRYEINYRDVNLQKVDQELFRITKEIVGSHCYNLDNYKTMDVRLVSVNPRFSMDIESRVLGSVLFSVKVYDILNPTRKEES